MKAKHREATLSNLSTYLDTSFLEGKETLLKKNVLVKKLESALKDDVGFGKATRDIDSWINEYESRGRDVMGDYSRWLQAIKNNGYIVFFQFSSRVRLKVTLGFDDAKFKLIIKDLESA